MLEEVRTELYGDSCNYEETEDEKKERQQMETEEVLQMLQSMGNKKD